MVDIWGRNLSSSSNITGSYLPLDGSTSMMGNLNMGANTIINMSDPVLLQDAASKGYVDAGLLTCVKKSGDIMTGTLNMSNNYITNLINPFNPQDAATKYYVDNTIPNNQSGLIPVLSSNNNNRNGIIVSASSEFSSSFQAWCVFANHIIDNGGSSDWATAGVTSNFWLQIQVPIAIQIWKFQVRGRLIPGNAPISWKLYGGNDGVSWTILYTSTGGMTTNVQEFILSPKPTVGYTYYQINVFTAGGTNPGMAHLQFF